LLLFLDASDFLVREKPQWRAESQKAEIEQFIFDPLADEKDWFVCLNGMPRK
jgi:hypothetical protein